MVATAPAFVQLPLIHVVESDDLYLARAEDILWYAILRDFDWQLHRETAARYYEALWQFNVEQAQAREAEDEGPNPETREEATGRLFGERPTQGGETPILAPAPRPPRAPPVDPLRLQPGRPPFRLRGRTPKCFFALLRAFVGLAIRGQPPEAEQVHDELVSNPAYARTCGFTIPDPRRGYAASDVPSLRKLEQFDQIMDRHALWGEVARVQVQKNLDEGRVKPEATVVHDTTHHLANSDLRVIELPPKKEGQKPRRVSHPRTTKACRCEDRATCPHPWVSADEGAGTVNKSTGKSWAHKASTLGFPAQGVILDAVAMTDAASHDSRSVVPHLERVRSRFPEVLEAVTRLLDDSAADDRALKETVHQDFGIELLAPVNPRGRKPQTKDLPRGVEKIEPSGTPVCRAGFPFDFLGCRHPERRFLFRAPLDREGDPVCAGCAQKQDCCRAGGTRRQISVSFDRLPWIDPALPQLSRRFDRILAGRTAIERIHKLMKFDYGDAHLSRRGTPAYQSRLDKTVFAMHLVLAHG